MFEVDFLSDAQGTQAGAGRGKPGTTRALMAPQTLRGAFLNGWVLAACVLGFGSLGVSIRLAFGATERLARLDATLRESLQDSVRMAELLRTRSAAENRRDSLAARASLIEAIDARRYDWPHLLEEVAVATPEQVWISRISAVSSGRPAIRFRVEGHALDDVGLARFWNALEASLFVEHVELVSAEQDPVRGAGTDGAASASSRFVIEADWEAPSPDVLDFVALGEVEA